MYKLAIKLLLLACGAECVNRVLICAYKWVSMSFNGIDHTSLTSNGPSLVMMQCHKRFVTLSARTLYPSSMSSPSKAGTLTGTISKISVRGCTSLGICRESSTISWDFIAWSPKRKVRLDGCIGIVCLFAKWRMRLYWLRPMHERGAPISTDKSEGITDLMWKDLKGTWDKPNSSWSALALIFCSRVFESNSILWIV